MGVRDVTSLETSGILHGEGLQGTFHRWKSPQDERYDQTLGVARQSAIRQGSREWIADQYGNVRELRGILLQRTTTDDFVAGGAFVSKPQYDSYAGTVQLSGGRRAYDIRVKPPGGLVEDVDVDASTFMIDRVSYVDADGHASTDYFDYRVYAGALVAETEVDSNGDSAFDIARAVRRVRVDDPIPASVFTVPPNNEVETSAPVTVPLHEANGHYFVSVAAGGRSYTFLVDTGAQAIILDTRAAQQLGLHPQGKLEVEGTKRVGGMGIAALDSIQIGGATLRTRVVSVVDLSGIGGGSPVDGVLGYPFFASAEVEFDAAGSRMTFARPGTLGPRGANIPVDLDRAMVEALGRVNGVDGRFVIDTGNAGELLLFAPFMKLHPTLLPPQDRSFTRSYGFGGSANALNVIVGELDLGPYRFYNRYANVMLERRGAFADRFAAGNVGMGVLRNLVVTFDLANRRVFALQSSVFHDGRRRPVGEEPVTIPH